MFEGDWTYVFIHLKQTAGSLSFQIRAIVE